MKSKEIELSEIFTPRDYQLPLFDAIENKGYKRVIAIMPRRCISGDSFITMANGSYKKLKDIIVGDQIASWNGKSIVEDTVNNVWVTGTKKTVTIKSPGYLPITTSRDHLFATTGCANPESTPVIWEKAISIRSTRCLLHYSGKPLGSRNDPDIWNGCYRSKFVRNESQDEELYDLETEANHNFIANGYVVHNSGKDITAFNLTLRQALRKVGVYFYIFPTYSQGRKVIWDSITNDGKKFLDFIPKELVSATNSTEMKISLTNGSIIQLIGSENVDSIVGTNPCGIIFSEYALQDPRAYQFMRPVLTANDGWAMFCSTPRGKNSFYDLYKIGLQNPAHWFVYKLTVEDTKHISLEDIEQERNSGEMSEDLILQEYYCSFEMGVEGSYYGKYMDKIREAGQITSVPYEVGHKVHTAWDLGMRDSTTIIFFQTIGQTIRVIDCYENSQHGLEHYAKVLQAKPYVYGKHIAPHDIKVRELGSGMSRIEKAKQLGISFVVAPGVSIADGIEVVRTTINKMYFDEGKCKPLIKAIENYRQEYDAKKKTYKNHPLHDWSSHFCDCLRYLCISLPKTHDGLTPEDLERRYQNAMHGEQGNLPHIFRT